MCVDTHVPSGARQGLALAVRDVLLGLRVAVLLGHTKVDDVNDVGGFGRGAANEEVVGLDIAVDEVLLVDGLHPREHLLGDHHHGLGREPAVAVVKQIFETRAEQVDHKDVVQPFLSEIVDIGDTSYDRVSKGGHANQPGSTLTASDQNLVRPVLISQLWRIALARFLNRSQSGGPHDQTGRP